ncbi:MAG: DUF4013 domain-containing protein [Candidatus Obscuribacter sp.]|nr:DUF4013 domain-containing protein [Candidatus Obscuribacter sp.]
MTEAESTQIVTASDVLSLSFKSITSEPGWMVKVMIGSLISYLAATTFVVNQLFLPLCVALLGLSYGYLLRVMRQCIVDPSAKLPEWNNWIDLLISGISWAAIGMGFTFVGLGMIASVLIIGAETGSCNISDPRFNQWALASFISLFALFNCGHFFGAVLMANFAEEESMAAGFAWLKVLKRIAKKPLLFLSAWLCAFALSILATLLPIASMIFAVMTPFAIFFAQIIGARLMARAWSASA